MVAPQAVQFALSVLALLALGLLFVLALGLILGLVGRGERLRELFRGLELSLAFIAALTATGGSLYFSEVAHYTPCLLCWYQRIAMYPMVVVLAVGLVRRDAAVAYISLPLALIGGAISVYHYQLEWFPEQSSICSAAGPPCSLVWFREFGFITIPFLAGTAFLLIASMSALAIHRLRRSQDEQADPDGARGNAGDDASRR
jgi:disulfide bond formation protein DsbB